MKKLIITAVVLLGLQGCAYFANRSRDACDVFTASVGHGAGAVVQVGPIRTGLGVIADNFGIRDGTPICDSTFLGSQDSMTSEALIFGGDHLYVNSDRPKGFGTTNIALVMPFVESNNAEWSYYTRVDVGVAVGGGARLGVNFGELFDFIFGIFGVDIIGDDRDIIDNDVPNQSLHQSP